MSRKQNADKLQTDENHYRIIFENAIECIFESTLEGRVFAANPAFVKMLGYDSEADVLQSLTDLPNQLWVNSSEYAVFKQMIENQGYVKGYECEFKRKNGEKILISLNATISHPHDGQVHLHSSFEDISERKLAEEKLRGNELKYRTLYESARSAILLFSEGRWVECNETTLVVFGCTREQIVGEHPIRFSPYKQPDGRISSEEAIKKINLAYSQGPQFFEWLHCRADGSLFDAEVSLKCMKIEGKLYIQCIVWDITERKRAERALQESNMNLMKLLNSSLFGVITVSLNKEIRWANPAAIDMIGANSLDELVGKKCYEHFCPAKINNCPIIDNKQRIDHSERQLNRKDGKQIPILKTVTEIELSGEQLLLETFIDITNESRYKNELELSIQKLSKRLDQTMNAISKIGELRDVYTAGHQKRVAKLACAIAQEMGLSEEVISNISYGALIHDIGKIYIASDILNKPSKLSNFDFKLFRLMLNTDMTL